VLTLARNGLRYESVRTEYWSRRFWTKVGHCGYRASSDSQFHQRREMLMPVGVACRRVPVLQEKCQFSVPEA